MSREAENAAWATTLPTAAKMVLISLADQCNDAGWAFARVEYIATRCSMSDRNVFRLVDRLHAEGYITIKPRKGRSSVYIVHVAEDGEPLITSQRTTPDNLSGVKRIEYAERIAAQTIAELMEKRMRAREERMHRRMRSDESGNSNGGSSQIGTPDNLSGVKPNDQQVTNTPDTQSGGGDTVSGVPLTYGQGGMTYGQGPLTQCHPESSLNPLLNPLSESSLNPGAPDVLKKTGRRGKKSAETSVRELEQTKAEQLKRIDEAMQRKQAGAAP